jgi:hypothetical protein
VRGAPGGAQRDILHIILTAVLVLLILLSIGFGAAAFGKRFRLYSIGTLTLVVVFGALAGVQGGRMAANQPTPWMGIEERINIFGFLLWVAVLAIALLRAQTDRPEASIGAPTARHSALGQRGGAQDHSLQPLAKH